MTTEAETIKACIDIVDRAAGRARNRYRNPPDNMPPGWYARKAEMLQECADCLRVMLKGIEAGERK